MYVEFKGNQSLRAFSKFNWDLNRGHQTPVKQTSVKFDYPNLSLFH